MHKYKTRIVLHSKGKTMYLKFVLPILFVFVISQSQATTYKTTVNGNWSNQGCWQNGIIAPFNNADTIVIKHLIILPSNLTLLNGAHLSIESSGGLCGHYQIFMYDASSITKYGILEIDALNMYGGVANLLPPGNTIFTQYGALSGGSFFNNSNLMVGPWFECQMPEYQFVNSINETLKAEKFNIYPNPVKDFFSVDLGFNQSNSHIKIIDCTGAVVLYEQYFNAQNQFYTGSLKQGMYFIEIMSDNRFFAARFCKE